MTLFNQTPEPHTPTVLDVLMYPHPALKEVSQLVTTTIPGDLTLQNLIVDMEATLRRYNALGLAAIQVGVPLRVLIVREPVTDKITVVINPIVKSSSGESYENEGCLSVPGVFTRIRRPQTIEVEFFDQHGIRHTTGQSDQMARAILHEIDHLNGVVFLDKMTSVQKNSALKKLKVVKRKYF